jgi:uncharacterized protein involved in exopolysaccharide biosynthesis
MGMFRRWWWIFLLMAGIGPVLGSLGAAVVTYVMPKKYESVAVVQVTTETGPSHSMSPHFMATEMEVITARKTLEMVEDRLDLTIRWGIDRGPAVEMVKELVHVENPRGTDLLQIRVRHTNAEDARDIAMEMANAYCNRRAELEQKRASQEESIQARLPRRPVVIHEEPTIARAPVSPKVSLNLALGLVGGVPLGLVLALPLVLLIDRIAGRKG